MPSARGTTQAVGACVYSIGTLHPFRSLTCLPIAILSYRHPRIGATLALIVVFLLGTATTSATFPPLQADGTAARSTPFRWRPGSRAPAGLPHGGPAGVPVDIGLDAGGLLGMDDPEDAVGAPPLCPAGWHDRSCGTPAQLERDGLERPPRSAEEVQALGGLPGVTQRTTRRSPTSRAAGRCTRTSIMRRT